jgi:hypothetical protein
VPFTYPGWERDYAEAEQLHDDYQIIFDRLFGAMKRKQKIYDGNRSHPQLVSLDSMKFTYNGRQQHYKEAEEYHVHHPADFEDFLTQMKKRQCIHEGNRSHPQLKALDSLTFSYLGWEMHYKEAERNHIEQPILFDGCLEGMKKMQKIHDGDHPHLQLEALDGNLNLKAYVDFKYPREYKEAGRNQCLDGMEKNHKLKAETASIAFTSIMKKAKLPLITNAYDDVDLFGVKNKFSGEAEDQSPLQKRRRH